MALNTTQLSNAQSIVDYGKGHGFSDSQVELAIKAAFLESSLGLNMTNPQPGITAAGMFGYNNDGWSTHTSLGVKNDTANQIAAFFSDITTFTSRYDNPVVKNSGITVDEYIYIKHHDGPNATDFVNSQGLKIFRASNFHLDLTSHDNTPYGAHGFDLYDPVYLATHGYWFADSLYRPTANVDIGQIDVSPPGSDQD